jgi:hypothetical protein
MQVDGKGVVVMPILVCRRWLFDLGDRKSVNEDFAVQMKRDTLRHVEYVLCLTRRDSSFRLICENSEAFTADFERVTEPPDHALAHDQIHRAKLPLNDRYLSLYYSSLASGNISSSI